jgi:hypothetical protein
MQGEIGTRSSARGIGHQSHLIAGELWLRVESYWMQAHLKGPCRCWYLLGNGSPRSWAWIGHIGY